MMHDFAMTAGHVVFMDLPIVFQPRPGDRRQGHAIPVGRRLRRPVRRAAPGRPVRRDPLVRHRPCYVFHVVNAFDTGDSLEIQAIRYPELWRHDGGFDADGVLWSWTLDLARGTVTERQLDERRVEFPRIDDRLAGRPPYGASRSVVTAWCATT